MVDVLGVISIVIFYLLILIIGLWAGRKKNKNTTDGSSKEDEILLAGRNLGVLVGIFTMTATWVGGGYINGTAEAIYTTGLVWCQAPFGNAISLVIGGFFFANKMRERGYVTMLDPLQDTYGRKMGGLLFIPALCAEVFWAASILTALGSTLTVVIDMDKSLSVILSACIAAAYTLFGGLRSVAYTDVIQLICIFIGLWLCIPFALTNDAVPTLSEGLSNPNLNFIGELETKEAGKWFDYAMLLIFGGLPWQAYFQRVLSCKTARNAEILSYVAGFGCFCMAIPSVLIGGIAKIADWNQTDYGMAHDMPDPSSNGDSAMVLPLVIKHLTPEIVSLFGLGAVAAAVMSSADSCVLSASSMFARNIYRLMFRPNVGDSEKTASENEITWVMRISVFAVTSLSVTLALTVSTVYGLWITYSDLVYVILFPQLLMAVHFPTVCNGYGSFAAYIVAIFLRLAGGEELLGLKALIHYPFYEAETEDKWEEQRFPFRTFAMLMSLITLPIVSKLADMVIERSRKDTQEWELKPNMIEDRL